MAAAATDNVIPGRLVPYARRRAHPGLLLLLLAAIFAAPNAALAQQAGAATKWRADGLRFEIAPLSGDQVRGFFIGRGFSAENAGFLAMHGCIFRSAIGNAGTQKTSPKVEIDLKTWRVISGVREGSPRLRESWAPLWLRRGVSEEARIAFHWALFPSTQLFSPTDYNWGMISFHLPAGSTFDLDVKWRTGTMPHMRTLKGLQCG